MAENVLPFASQGQEAVWIPLYDVDASAGGGAVISEERIVDRLAFRLDWIQKTLGVRPKDLVLISTSGDSMVPTLHPRDLLLMDRSVESLDDDAIYAVQMPDGLMVKRVQRDTDGTVLLKSDNPQYPPFSLDPSRLEQLRVVGKLVWSGKRF